MAHTQQNLTQVSPSPHFNTICYCGLCFFPPPTPTPNSTPPSKSPSLVIVQNFLRFTYDRAIFNLFRLRMPICRMYFQQLGLVNDSAIGYQVHPVCLFSYPILNFDKNYFISLIRRCKSLPVVSSLRDTFLGWEGGEVCSQ